MSPRFRWVDNEARARQRPDQDPAVRCRLVTVYEFLSPEWIEAAIGLRDEYAEHLPEPPAPVRMNLVVTGVPHGDHDRIEASIETAENGLLPMLGHLESPELTVTLDYVTARSLFIDQDPEAVGQAFFAGRIQIEGDMTRIFFLQTLEPSDEQRALADEVKQRLDDMTAL